MIKRIAAKILLPASEISSKYMLKARFLILCTIALLIHQTLLSGLLGTEQSEEEELIKRGNIFEDFFSRGKNHKYIEADI